MKKTLFSIALFLCISIVSVARNSKSVDPKSIASFNRDFSGASNVTWEEGTTYSKVTFTIRGSILFAYYANNGNLIASSRNITSTQLPLHLFTELKNEYSAYWITDLFELSVNDSTDYYITIENANGKRILHSSRYGWENYDSTAKD